MKPSEIEVGKTYRNRGAGKTTRTVLAIGGAHRPKVYYNATGDHPNDKGVLFYDHQNGEKRNLYLKSFAKWAGHLVD